MTVYADCLGENERPRNIVYLMSDSPDRKEVLTEIKKVLLTEALELGYTGRVNLINEKHPQFLYLEIESSYLEFLDHQGVARFGTIRRCNSRYMVVQCCYKGDDRPKHYNPGFDEEYPLHG